MSEIINFSPDSYIDDYSKEDWVLGKVITPDALNKIEEGIVSVTDHVKTIEKDTFQHVIKDMILIQNTEPINYYNNVWIEPINLDDTNSFYAQIPTLEEFNNLSQEVDNIQSQVNTNVPTLTQFNNLSQNVNSIQNQITTSIPTLTQFNNLSQDVTDIQSTIDNDLITLDTFESLESKFTVIKNIVEKWQGIEEKFEFKSRPTTGIYFNWHPNILSLDGAGKKYITTDIIQCKSGDRFKISACGSNSLNSCPLGVGFYDDKEGKINPATIQRPGVSGDLSNDVIVQLKDYIYEVPAGYNRIAVNHLSTTKNFQAYVVKLSKDIGLQDNVNLIKTDVENLKSQIYIPEWIVPQHIYGVEGHPFSLYYYNTLLLDSLDGYHVRVNTDTNIHPTETDRINFLCDTSIPSKSVWLRLHKDTQQNKITEKKITLHVVSEKPASSARTPINAIFIGDSFTEQRRYLAELQNLAENGSSIALTLYGTRGSTTTSTLDSNGNGRTPKHEGRSGWTVKDYLHTWLHWYNKTSTDYKNDFYTPDSVTGKDWNILKDYSDKYDELRQQNRSNHTDVEDTNNVHFDFSGYIARQGYNNITDVFIYLGTNDAAAGYPATQDPSITENRNNFIDDYEEIIKSIQAYNTANPDKKVRIHCMAPLTVRGLTGTTEIGRQRTLEYTKALIDKWDNKVEGIYFVPTHINFNKEYDFKTQLVRATYRNPTKRLVYYDGIHPNEYGYYSIADIIYSHILYYCVP